MGRVAGALFRRRIQLQSIFCPQRTDSGTGLLVQINAPLFACHLIMAAPTQTILPPIVVRVSILFLNLLVRNRLEQGIENRFFAFDIKQKRIGLRSEFMLRVIFPPRIFPPDNLVAIVRMPENGIHEDFQVVTCSRVAVEIN